MKNCVDSIIKFDSAYLLNKHAIEWGIHAIGKDNHNKVKGQSFRAFSILFAPQIFVTQ